MGGRPDERTEQGYVLNQQISETGYEKALAEFGNEFYLEAKLRHYDLSSRSFLPDKLEVILCRQNIEARARKNIKIVGGDIDFLYFPQSEDLQGIKNKEKFIFKTVPEAYLWHWLRGKEGLPDISRLEWLDRRGYYDKRRFYKWLSNRGINPSPKRSKDVEISVLMDVVNYFPKTAVDAHTRVGAKVRHYSKVNAIRGTCTDYGTECYTVFRALEEGAKVTITKPQPVSEGSWCGFYFKGGLAKKFNSKFKFVFNKARPLEEILVIKEERDKDIFSKTEQVDKMKDSLI